MFKNKVSIILPVYNQELYLNTSIPAVLEQTYNDLEIVCVNDGSTDSSYSILLKYAENDDRIKIISQENRGLASAVETGVNNSTGEYICFLDPDDLIGENFIQTFIDAIDDCDVVSAGYYSRINGKDIANVISSPGIYTEDKLEMLKNDFLLDKRNGNLSKLLFVARWNKLYRAECVKEAMKGYKLCQNVSLGEDTLFTFLVLCNAKKIKTLAVVNTYYYTIGSQTSMMSNGSIDKHVEKAKNAKSVFEELLFLNNNDYISSNVLYFFLVESLFQRLKNGEKREFEYLYLWLKQDDDYVNALKYLEKSVQGIKKWRFKLRIIVSNPRLFLLINRIIGVVK